MSLNKMGAIALKSLLVSLVLCHPVFAKNRACKFQVTSDLKLNFGVIDPSSVAPVSAPVVAVTVGSDQAGDCKKLTMTVAARTGTVLQLTNGTGGVIPYSLTTFTTAAPGNNKYSQVVLQGTITPANFQNAPAGLYSQSNVVLDVSP
jgi:hypothetical protein